MAIKTSTYVAAGILTLAATPVCLHLAGASGNTGALNFVKMLHGGGAHHAAPAKPPEDPEAVPAALTSTQTPDEKAPAKNPAADLTGKWALTILSGQQNLECVLAVKQAGAKITGTMSNPHGSDELIVTGELKNGALSIAADGAGTNEMHLKFAGKVLDNGQLAGKMTSVMGENDWKAARAK